MRPVERIIVGTALVISSSVLLPIAKKTLSTVLRTGADTLSDTMSGVRTGLVLVREELEDIVAEAQFERLKNRVDEEMLN